MLVLEQNFETVHELYAITYWLLIVGSKILPETDVFDSLH